MCVCVGVGVFVCVCVCVVCTFGLRDGVGDGGELREERSAWPTQ